MRPSSLPVLAHLLPPRRMVRRWPGLRLRRYALFLPLLLLPLLLATRPAAAQDWPTRPLRMVVPFPPGAGPDQVARLVAEHLRSALGQPVVVENRAGALGSIGAAEIARAAPDGHTIGIITNSTHASNVSMFRNLGYDPVADFAPIGRLITTAMVLLVRPDFPVRDLAGFLAHARARPGQLTAGYGSGATQMSLARLRSLGGVETVLVPYRGVPLAVADVISGSLSLSLADYAVALAQIQGGTLRGLGVTASSRSELMPELPALAEAIPGFDVTIWYGLTAPARTPGPIIARLAELTAAFLADPAIGARLRAAGLSPAALPPTAFDRFIRAEIVNWTAAAREAGIEPQ